MQQKIRKNLRRPSTAVVMSFSFAGVADWLPAELRTVRGPSMVGKPRTAYNGELILFVHHTPDALRLGRCGPPACDNPS